MRFDWTKELCLTEKDLQYKALWQQLGGDLPPEAYLDDLPGLRRLSAAFWAVKTGAPGTPGHLPPAEARVPFPQAAGPAAAGLAVQRHAPYFPVPLHQHEFVEVLCVAHGGCCHVAGSFRSRLACGDVVLIAPGTRHAFLACQDDAVIYQLLLDLTQLDEHYRGFLRQPNAVAEFLRQTTYAGGRNSFLLLHTGDYFSGDNLLAALVAEYQGQSAYRAGKLHALVQLLFFELLEHQAASPLCAVDPATASGRDELLLAYTRTHADTVTLPQLCLLFHYSSRQIARIFQAAAGMSFTAYVQQCRVERAAQLLAQGPIRVKDAMELAGVRNASRFYQEFAARFGLTPAQYQARQRQRHPTAETVDLKQEE